jgi:hypothetical protein
VPAAYLEANAELAYAGNVHVAQGRTVDAGHVLVSPTLSRESLYVGMSRGREANTAHVVTGPAQRGREPLAQAPPEAVLADVMAREERNLTATETMREVQDFSGSSRHMFTMWSATTRETAYREIDERLRERLTARDYARYLREPQRAVFQRQIRSAQLAGADIDQVLDQATAQNMTGARSVAAALHGRVKKLTLPGAGKTVTWAERTPAAARPGIGGRLAEGLDTRQRYLGEQLYANPEPWLVRHLGPPPGPDASEALKADYIQRAGIAASYREAAGITDPNVSLGEAPRGMPELNETWKGAAYALEIPDEEAAVRAMSRGELEARQARASRVLAHAPAEVSGELRAAEHGQADAEAEAAGARARGDSATAAAAQARADAASLRATELTGQHEVYREYEATTEPERRTGELAGHELSRRAGTVAEREEPQAGTVAAEAERETLWQQMQQDAAGADAAQRALDREREHQGAGPETVEPEREPERQAEAPETVEPAAAQPSYSSGPEFEAEPAEMPGPSPETVARSARIEELNAAAAAGMEQQAARDASREREAQQEHEAQAEAMQASAWQQGAEAPSWRDAGAEREAEAEV